LTVQTTEPHIEHRATQPYIAIRLQREMYKLPIIVPRLIAETAEWLAEKDISHRHTPFIRYHVLGQTSDFEVGWFVTGQLTGDRRVTSGRLTAGNYATLIYTDANKSIEGSTVLIDWAKEQKITWDTWATNSGQAFKSRVEIFHNTPYENPDPTTWRTEVAIKIADD